MLVVRGEAGVGKTALLEYAAERRVRAAAWRAPPAPSPRWSSPSRACTSCARRCSTASTGSPSRSGPRCGRRSGSRTATRRPASWSALAVLSLLAEAAEERPLFCLVDDAQWLDQASAQALAFVARRLLAERIALVFAVREPSDDRELAGLPELRVEGLGEDDARPLLASAIRGRVDERVRDRIIAEARGNPLALLELPGGSRPSELAGGYALPGREAAGRADRAELPAPARAAAAGLPAAAADRGGRAGRRRDAAVARGGAARHRRGGVASRPRRPG